MDRANSIAEAYRVSTHPGDIQLTRQLINFKVIGIPESYRHSPKLPLISNKMKDTVANFELRYPCLELNN